MLHTLIFLAFLHSISSQKKIRIARHFSLVKANDGIEAADRIIYTIKERFHSTNSYYNWPELQNACREEPLKRLIARVWDVFSLLSYLFERPTTRTITMTAFRLLKCVQYNR